MSSEARQLRARRRRAEAELLPEGRAAGPMPWVSAIMMFLTVLAAALALGVGSALLQLRGDLAGRYSIQIVEADAARRSQLVAATGTALSALPFVEQWHAVPQDELRGQLSPWLGEEALSGSDIPIPALIDVKLRSSAPSDARQALSEALRRVAPQIRLEAHATFLAPAERLMRSVLGLAVLLVALMLSAMAAIVILAARGALAANRSTIAILHQLGATDIQVARLFQRRAALDALAGALLGTACAAGALLLVGGEWLANATAFAGLMRLPLWGWVVLAVIPLLAVILALFTARITVRRAMEKAL